MALPCITSIFNYDAPHHHASYGCRPSPYMDSSSSSPGSDYGNRSSYTEHHPLEKSRVGSLNSSGSSDDDDLSRYSPTPEPQPLPIKYNIIKHLGSGSFGEVSLIINPLSLQVVPTRKIALKRIRMSRLNQRQREEVEYEVMLQETLTRTENTHIVHCYGARDDPVTNEKHIYLEYVDGSDLFELAMNKGGVGQTAAVSYFRQLLEGLTFLHDLYVAHRDIKPENLLIDKLGTLKIADFGLADCYRESDDEPDRRLSRICGSYEYLSPQVLVNDYSGPKNDVWAAGCVLIVMLTGDLAWDRADSNDRNYSLWANGDLPPLLKTLNQSAITIIGAALEIDEDRRFTARQLLSHPWLTSSTKRKSNGSCTDDDDDEKSSKRQRMQRR